MKLQVIDGEQFSCGSCTNCCRDWHVELTAAEVEAIPKLRWPAGDPLASAEALFRHSGRVFLAHKADASCLYLNLANGLCRIHEQFGEAAKPLGCRLYPFQVTPTFRDALTVTARFDCPQVRENKGASHSKHLPELRTLSRGLAMPKPLDEPWTRSLSPDQLTAISEFLATLLNAFPSDEGKSLFLYLFASVLEATPATQVSREFLGSLFPDLKAKVDAAVAAKVAKPGMTARIVFRTLLAQYLRRDEDLLNGKATRGGRLLAITRVVLGGGSLHDLGVVHPRGSLAKARLFSPAMPAENGAFSLVWRAVRVKLESQQYFGAAVGRDIVDGLRSLATFYPLVRAVAKYVAANRNSGKVEATDVSAAVGAIDHAFGRSAVLKQSHARRQEEVLLQPANFTALVRHT